MALAATERQTYDVPHCARLLGIHERAAYDLIQRTDRLAGVRVIRAGRRVLIPAAAFDRVLAGESEDRHGD